MYGWSGFGNVCDDSGNCYDASGVLIPDLPFNPNPACTCVLGVCTETGNSCSSPGPSTPMLPNGTAAPKPGPPVNQQSATQWLNANAGSVALGVGGFIALMLIAKAGR